ncbi:MAG: hypothetical protein AAGK23_14185 [Pseudomonadota bacterium]
MAQATLPETLTLRGSRLKALGFLMLAAPLFLAGLFMVLSGNNGWVAWASFLFFGACELVFVFQIINPGQLTLDRHGFKQSLMGRSVTNRWVEVSCFGVYEIKQGFITTNRFVCYDRFEDDGKTLAKINRAMAGASAQLGDTFGMKAEDLAALMNAFRDRAVEAKHHE